MIVKTGANYQAEGGYIEASRNGHEYTINGNTINDTYGVFSMAEVVFRNRSNNSVTAYVSNINEAMFSPKTIPSGGGGGWHAVLGGRMEVVLDNNKVDTGNSTGCVVEDSNHIRITDINAEVIFINA